MADSTTIRIGMAMSARKVVNNVWVMSNSKTTPTRMSSILPGTKKPKMST